MAVKWSPEIVVLLSESLRACNIELLEVGEQGLVYRAVGEVPTNTRKYFSTLDGSTAVVADQDSLSDILTQQLIQHGYKHFGFESIFPRIFVAEHHNQTGLSYHLVVVSKRSDDLSVLSHRSGEPLSTAER